MTSFPHDRPFRSRDTGLDRRQLSQLHQQGVLRRLLKGVYVAADVPDTLWLRARALGLVNPPGGVVTDRAAAWLYGVDLLLPDEVHVVPPIQVFHTGRGRRIGHQNCSSGQRMMPPADWQVIETVRVTTPIRTALDLGRLAHRDRAFAALDAFLRYGVDHDRLLGQIERFKGYRGVCQLRTLAPFADPRAESGAESVTRLRWLDSGQPRPTPQVEILGPDGVLWRLDLGVEELFFAVEYDGAQFHESDEQRARDAWRRGWIAENTPWHVEVVRRENIYGRQQDFVFHLPGMIASARRTLGERMTRGTWTHWD